MRPFKTLRSRPTIGVLSGWQAYTGTLHSFLDRVFQGIITRAADRECNLLIGCGTGRPYGVSFGRPAWPLHSPEVDFIPVGPWNCDGLIIVPAIGYASQTEYVNQLIKQRYPMVFVGDIQAAPSASADNYGGVREAVDHLVAHGHRRIAYISGRHGGLDGDSQRRLQGYLDGLQHNGIGIDPNLISPGFHSIVGGRQAAADLLSRKVEFSAIIASNDESAIGAMQVLQAAGRQTPRDVAVIGFDDRIDARAQSPMLASVHYPMFEVGHQAVDLLIKYIDGTLTQLEQMHIPAHLVTRESCGCQPGMVSVFTPGQGSFHRTILDAEGLPALTRTIAAIVSREEFHTVQVEVEDLSQRLVAALQNSLYHGDSAEFLAAFQQILADTSSQNNNLIVWYKVISEIRNWIPVLVTDPLVRLNPEQAEEMLNRLWNAASEIIQGHSARQQVHSAQQARHLSEIFSNLSSVSDAHTIYAEITRQLPNVGIQHSSVVFQHSELAGESTSYELQNPPPGLDPTAWHFTAGQFPPPGLFSDQSVFHLALLPITIQNNQNGFVALDTGNMDLCALVVQQLTAALRSAHFFREAVAARQIAETEQRRVEQANRVKNHFLSWVVHELRTPVSLIYGLSDMLLQVREQADSSKILVDREDIDRFHIGSEHLVNLIRDVLDLSSSELGQLKLAFEVIDLKDELENILLISRKQAQNKGLALRAEISAALPQVRGDRTRIRQIVLNILNNAIKFTSHGEVILRAENAGRAVKITIQDTGLGIPLSEQALIFEEFRQSERTAERSFGGLGLGLAICKRLVEMHGGQIGVHSSGEEGQGSTFYFTLPAALDLSPSPASNAEPKAGQNVLLLVDRPAESGPLRAYLAQIGCTVTEKTAAPDTNWREAVLSSRPDAILLDSGLAVRLGWEILKALKENPDTLDLPVIFYSLSEKDRSGALLEFDYLTKPVNSNSLVKALQAQHIFSDSASPENSRTILIVDDEKETLELHARMVQAQLPHCRVVLARSGREALKLLQQPSPDLVLLDLMMPEMDGFAVIEAMRRDESTRKIPVIVLTGQALDAQDMQRLNAKVSAVLGKGIYSQTELLAHVTEILQRRRKTGSESLRVTLKAMAYIHLNYACQISRKDIAEHVGLSERHLTRCFNLELGITPMTYLNRYRVKQARQLLEGGQTSIAQIAEQVGFSSGEYFSRVFREEVGISPREYEQGKTPENMSQKWKNSSFK